MPTALRAQTNRAIVLGFNEQTDYDVPPLGNAGGAERIRFANSSGLLFRKARVPSRESRNDGKGRRGDQGPALGEFAVSNDFVLGAYNTPMKHVMRSALTAAATVTQADVAGISGVSGATISFGGGDATTVFNPGDLFVAATGLHANDIGKPLVILSVITGAITVNRTLTTNGAAANWSFARSKYHLDGAVDSAMLFEEFKENNNRHELGPWGRWGSFAYSFGPRGSMIDLAFTCAFARKPVRGSGAYFTAPTLATGVGLSSSRHKLWIPGITGDLRLSALNIGKNLNLYRDDTSAEEAYEIGVGQPTWNFSFTCAEVNDDLVAAYEAGTVLSAVSLIELPGVGSFSTYIPQFVLQDPQKSARGSDSFSTRSFAGDIDVDERGGVFESTNIKVSSTI